MKPYIEDRVREVANFIIATRSTIRKTGKALFVSKSTVMKDVQRLEKINPLLLNEVRSVLECNKATRHIRGGKATKMKYKRS